MSATPRPAFVGFAGMLVDTGLGVALDERVLRAHQPPAECPTCGFPALDPIRDANGEWTWSCLEGCNP